MGDLLATNTTQAQMSSFFIDKMGLVSVKSFEATGDGVTNDTIAIQACATYATEQGLDAIFFPHGIYIVDAGIASDLSAFFLWGDNSTIVGDTVTINAIGSNEDVTAQLASNALQFAEIESDIVDLQSGNAGVSTVAKTAGYPDKWERIAVDNFDSIENFEFYTKAGVVDTDWTVTNNKISTVGATTDIIAWYKKVKLNDGIIRLIYENPDTTSTNYVGITFRRKDRANFMSAYVWDGNPGKVELWACVAGAHAKIGSSITFSTLDVANVVNTPKSIEVDATGNQVRIYVNNKLMITSTDASIENNMYGECGIFARNGKICTFSNFTILKKKFNVIHPSITKLLCSGTSVTYGVGATIPYPTLLHDKLETDFCVEALSLVNAGHSGKNSAEVLTYLITELPLHNPNIVVLEGNINDTSVSVGLTSEQAINNMRKMIKLCKQYGAIPILTTSSHTDPALATTNWDKTSFDKQVVNNILLTQLASEEDIRLVGVAKAFSNDFTLLADQIHPNDTGAELYAQTVFETIAVSE